MRNWNCTISARCEKKVFGGISENVLGNLEKVVKK